MPYSIKRVNQKGCRKKWSVYNRKTQKVFAKCTSKKRANKQLNLLRAILYNPNFVPNRKNRTIKQPAAQSVEKNNKYLPNRHKTRAIKQMNYLLRGIKNNRFSSSSS